MTIIIAKNNTSSAIPLDDLGVEVPGSGQRNLTDNFSKNEISASVDLDTFVSSGDITINDGTNDLSITDGLKHINFETEHEDADGIDGVAIYNDGVYIGKSSSLNFKNVTVNNDSTSEIEITIPSGEAVDVAIVQVLRTTTLTLTTSWADITFDTTAIEIDDSILKHDTTNKDRILILEDGTYEIEMNSNVRTTGTTTEVYHRIRVNDSVVIPSSQFTVDLYQDETHEMSRTAVYEFQANDFISLQMYKENTAGVSTLQVNASIVIKSLKGIKGIDGIDGTNGLPGEPGPPGTGSTINVLKDNTLEAPYVGNLNFTGGVNITQDSTGSVNIEILSNPVSIKKDGTVVSNPIESINFTGPVSVTEPTSKNVDVAILFGANYQTASSETDSSTTSTTYQQKLRMTTLSLPSGTYRIGWYYEAQHRDDRDDFMGRVQINDTTTLMEHQLESKDNGSDQWCPVSGFYYHTGSGVLNIDIDYASSVNAKTSVIRRARLEIWRVL